MSKIKKKHVNLADLFIQTLLEEGGIAKTKTLYQHHVNGSSTHFTDIRVTIEILVEFGLCEYKTISRSYLGLTKEGFKIASVGLEHWLNARDRKIRIGFKSHNHQHQVR